MPQPLSAEDTATVAAQLGRTPRGVAGVAWRCPCGRPGVVTTRPRLADGTPFPTTYYLTCPRAVGGCSTLEASGVMTELTDRVQSDPDLARAYRAAHEAYLADRTALGEVPELVGVSAGGMPDRVKCLHALLGHALAAGPGGNPIGDWVREQLGAFWDPACLRTDDDR